MKYTEDGSVYESIYGEKPKDVLQVRENARKKIIQLAVNRYFESLKNAKNKRYFWNDGKKKISAKMYRDILTRNKIELDNTLVGLLRKGDTIHSLQIQQHSPN